MKSPRLYRYCISKLHEWLKKASRSPVALTPKRTPPPTNFFFLGFSLFFRGHPNCFRTKAAAAVAQEKKEGVPGFAKRRRRKSGFFLLLFHLLPPDFAPLPAQPRTSERQKDDCGTFSFRHAWEGKRRPGKKHRSESLHRSFPENRE